MHTLWDMPGPRDAETPRRTPRRDAVRNDRLVLEAALAVFGERGPNASMEEIAARAGVGVGTIYRRFAGKEALLEALAVRFRAEMREAMTAAIGADDPERGLERFLEFVGEFNVAKQRLAPVVTERLGDRTITDDMTAMVATMTANAVRAGALAPGVTPDDVLALIGALRGVIERTDGGDSWRRFLRIHLAGLRVEAPSDARAVAERSST